MDCTIWPPEAAEGTGTEGICTMRPPRGTPNFLRDIENHSTACGEAAENLQMVAAGENRLCHIAKLHMSTGSRLLEATNQLPRKTSDMIRSLNLLVVKTTESNSNHVLSQSHLQIGQRHRNHQSNLGCTPLAIPVYHKSIPTMVTYAYIYIYIYVLYLMLHTDIVCTHTDIYIYIHI